MADIANQLTEHLKNAMRAKDSVALNTLRAVKSAIKNAAIEKGGADAELDEGAIVNIIRKQIKQRRESLEQFTKAGRSELADQEQAEISILEHYLPSPLSPEEVDDLVAKGVVFTHTYCQSPICTPSRSSFMSGLYPVSYTHLTLPTNREV